MPTSGLGSQKLVVGVRSTSTSTATAQGPWWSWSKSSFLASELSWERVVSTDRALRGLPARVSLIHPFTPAACGIPEDRVVSFGTSLHMALNDFQQSGRWRCDVSYLTESTTRYSARGTGDVAWHFFPKCVVPASRAERFAEQWSWALWRDILVNPPDIACFFLAYGNLAKLLAATCVMRRRPYIVIVGGWGVPRGRSQTLYFSKASTVIVHTLRQVHYLEFERVFSREHRGHADWRRHWRFFAQAAECISGEPRFAAPTFRGPHRTRERGARGCRGFLRSEEAISAQ